MREMGNGKLLTAEQSFPCYCPPPAHPCINICCNDNIDIDKRPQIYAQFG